MCGVVHQGLHSDGQMQRSHPLGLLVIQMRFVIFSLSDLHVLELQDHLAFCVFAPLSLRPPRSPHNPRLHNQLISTSLRLHSTPPPPTSSVCSPQLIPLPPGQTPSPAHSSVLFGSVPHATTPSLPSAFACHNPRIPNKSSLYHLYLGCVHLLYVHPFKRNWTKGQVFPHS